MNGARIRYVLAPLLIVLLFIFSTHLMSVLLEVRTWGNILQLGSIELFCFYVVSVTDMNINRKRFMCTILALRFIFSTSVYAVLTWVYFNFNISFVDGIQGFMYETYEPVSLIVYILLLIVSVAPRDLLNGISISIRADFYLNRINNFTGLYLFSIEKDSQ